LSRSKEEVPRKTGKQGDEEVGFRLEGKKKRDKRGKWGNGKRGNRKS